MTEIRKYRIDIENIPFIFNDKGIGISLFDVATAYIGAYLLDVIFRLPNKLPIPCKNTRTIYYLLVIPFGIIIHHILAHIISIKEGKGIIIPDEITFLNKKLFTLKPNIYHLVTIGLLVLPFVICNSR